jgi:hypothetical protein
MNDWIWRGGRFRLALGIALPAGVGVGALEFGRSGSAGEALMGAGVFIVIFGAFAAIALSKPWPGAKQLRPEDRHAVVRAVHRGEYIRDPRFARAVLEYCVATRRRQQRDRRFHWVLPVLGVLAALLAVGKTLNGSVRAAVVAWVLAVLWLGLFLWLPRQLARRRSNAERAEMHAQRILQSTGE